MDDEGLRVFLLNVLPVVVRWLVDACMAREKTSFKLALPLGGGGDVDEDDCKGVDDVASMVLVDPYLR